MPPFVPRFRYAHGASTLSLFPANTVRTCLRAVLLFVCNRGGARPSRLGDAAAPKLHAAKTRPNEATKPHKPPPAAALPPFRAHLLAFLTIMMFYMHDGTCNRMKPQSPSWDSRECRLACC